MKRILKQIVVPAGSAILGGLAVIVALKISPSLHAQIAGEQLVRPSHESFFDDFFGSQDPFEQMQKMREQLEKRHQNSGDPFQSWFSNPIATGGILNDITRREDDNSVYYDIQVEDVNSASIDTKVENGYLTITGTTEKTGGSQDDKENTSFAQSFSKSTFNRTFPLPDDVDPNKMQMTYEKDKIVLKFPKIKA